MQLPNQTKFYFDTDTPFSYLVWVFHYMHIQDAIRLDAISRFDRAFGGKIPLNDNTSIA